RPISVFMRTLFRGQGEKLGADPQALLLGGASTDFETNPVVLDEDVHGASLSQERGALTDRQHRQPFDLLENRRSTPPHECCDEHGMTLRKVFLRAEWA